MIFRFVVDPLQSKLQFEGSLQGLARHLLDQPMVLKVQVNRFIPADFVFRCKVVRCP